MFCEWFNAGSVSEMRHFETYDFPGEPPFSELSRDQYFFMSFWIFWTENKLEPITTEIFGVNAIDLTVEWAALNCVAGARFPTAEQQNCGSCILITIIFSRLFPQQSCFEKQHIVKQ